MPAQASCLAHYAKEKGNSMMLIIDADEMRRNGQPSLLPLLVATKSTNRQAKTCLIG
jgi:hypothetical protein